MVLVGAKCDLVKKYKKEVSYGEAFDLALKLNLAGFLEVSSKTPYKGDKDVLNDCFMIAAIHCIEKSTSNPFYAAGAKPAIQASDTPYIQNGSIKHGMAGSDSDSTRFNGRVLRKNDDGEYSEQQDRAAYNDQEEEELFGTRMERKIKLKSRNRGASKGGGGKGRKKK